MAASPSIAIQPQRTSSCFKSSNKMTMKMMMKMTMDMMTMMRKKMRRSRRNSRTSRIIQMKKKKYMVGTKSQRRKRETRRMRMR